MSAQPEALRLADALIAATGQTDAEDDVIHVARWFVEDAAAELRRLYLVEQALERCKAVCDATSEGWRADAERWQTQRDALLEVVELAADFLEHSTEFRIGHPGFEGPQAKARAAIKAVEEIGRSKE